MASSDDFFRRLEAVAPGVVDSARKEAIRRTRRRPLSEQVAEDVATVAEESEALVMTDARAVLALERDDAIEPMPEFIPEVGKRLCSGCGRMRQLKQFRGASRRCRGCGEG